MTFGRIIQQVGYLLFSFLSSVSIIFINKYIYNDKRVAGTLLMAFHFLTCFLVSYILHILNNLFQKSQKETTNIEEKVEESPIVCFDSPITNDELEIFSIFDCKFMTFRDGILLSLSVSLALLFGNLSLIHNSISVYQLSKLMTIPCLIAISCLKMERKIIISLGLIVLGMILVIGFDIILNWFGSVICLVAILAGTGSQLTINYYCKKYKMNGFELLLNHSLFSSILMAFVSIPVDGLESIAYSVNLFNSNSSFFLAVLTSGFAAFFVNVSGYLVIGKLSPLTFQVLGHAKTISILIGGFFLFGNEKDLSIHTLVGLSIALIGTFFYSYFKYLEEAAQQQNNLNNNSSNKEIEATLPAEQKPPTKTNEFEIPFHHSVSSFGYEKLRNNSSTASFSSDDEDESGQTCGSSSSSSEGADADGRIDEELMKSSTFEKRRQEIRLETV